MTKFLLDNLTYQCIEILASDCFIPLCEGDKKDHKQPIHKWSTVEQRANLPRSLPEALMFCETNYRCSGLGFYLSDNVILFDVDDKAKGQIVLNILKNDPNKLNFIYSETTKGFHFYFLKSHFKPYTQNKTKVYSAIGVECDIKGFENSYSAFVVNNQPRQYFIHGNVNSRKDLSHLPFYLTSLNVSSDKAENLKKAKTVEEEQKILKSMTKTQIFLMDLFLAGEGARNSLLHKFTSLLISENYSKEHLSVILTLVNNYILAEPLPNQEILVFVNRYEELREKNQNYIETVAEGKETQVEFKNKFEKLIHHIEMLGIAKYDTFTRDIYFNDEMLSDFVITKIMKELSINTTFENVQKALIYLANHNTYDSMQEHLNNLPNWDKVNRCEEFFINYCGAEDIKANRIAGLYFWASLYNRAYNIEGCKADTSIVLKGVQGLRKSTLIKRICWDDYASDRFNFLTNQNERTRRLKGYVIVEIGELKGLKNADVRELKDYLSLQVDDYRPNYSNYVQNLPRRNIFVLTTNEDEFLKDTTGNRRYAVVNCGINPSGMTKTKNGYKINIEALTDEIINQLWAEAKTIEFSTTLADEIEEAFKDINVINMIKPRCHEDVMFILENDDRFKDRFFINDLHMNTELCMNYQKSEIIKSLKLLGYVSKPVKIQGIAKRMYFKEQEQYSELETFLPTTEQQEERRRKIRE